MNNLFWRTEKRKIKDLKLFENNPRKMSKQQAEQLLRSLKKFNLVEIPAIDQNNRVIAGNMRVEALRKLYGDDYEIEVRVPSRPLTEEEAKDFDLLANFDEDLLKEVGFESIELDEIFSSEINEEFDAKKAINEVLQKEETRCKEGDLWQLGEHRLYIGDATKKESWEKVLQGEKIDMVFTDPPYGINIVKVGGGGKTKFGKVGGGKWVSANYYLPIRGDDKEFNPQFLLDFSQSFNAQRILIFGGNFFANKLPNSKCWLIWDKTGDNYIQNNFADCEIIWTNINKPSRIYRCKWRGLLKEKGEDIKKRIHPTQKPIKLLTDILTDFSKRGDIVMDCFGGSGSTLIACEILKRKCRMIEIEPIYGDVIINRWEKFTGKKAVKLETK